MGDDSTKVFTDIKAVLDLSKDDAKKSLAALLVVSGRLNGTLFDLKQPHNTLGRATDNSILLEFEGISRYHCKISKEEGDFILHDMGSKNGTFLNDKKWQRPMPLKKGDIIKVGYIALKFFPAGDPERLAYERLQHKAVTDQLTGCFNKAYFNTSISNEVKKSKISGRPLTLIFFDLDHFKSFNDDYGHDAGDYVLKEMALLIRQNGVRDRDVFARYGGEEFVILLPQTTLKQGFEIAQRLRRLLTDHSFIYGNKQLHVTASVGLADYRKGVNTGKELFKRADKAVYMAKESGRNQVQFFKE